jgi:hypothetical protein
MPAKNMSFPGFDVEIPMLSFSFFLPGHAHFVFGSFCYAAIEGSRQFRGDGYLIFTPDAKPIVLPWSASFAFRTRQTDSFLMKMEIDPGHSVLVEVKEKDKFEIHRVITMTIHNNGEI